MDGLDAAMRIGIYTGSFDPPTYGHLDILEQACSICDRVVVAIGVHPGKTPIFTPLERADLIRAVASELMASERTELEIAEFSGLAIEAARQNNARLIIRGLRDGTDLDYEMQMAGMNGAMAPEVKTIFFAARPLFRPITATLVRQIAAMGGDVTPFAPLAVATALKAKMAARA